MGYIWSQKTIFQKSLLFLNIFSTSHYLATLLPPSHPTIGGHINTSFDVVSSYSVLSAWFGYSSFLTIHWCYQTIVSFVFFSFSFRPSYPLLFPNSVGFLSLSGYGKRSPIFLGSQSFPKIPYRLHAIKYSAIFFSCVKAYSKNRHFRVFIMIKIGQTHVFQKDYVHIHQIGIHFVGGYRLDFLPTGQETRHSFCKLLALCSLRFAVEETK